ncbi:hypothetical protein [Bradyrhizobium sp. OAE829]|uniref:hypothetical protein n=1 Tax=Bradyrhizobium sp. OAE829 TaxID=2663807 RepID=UPI00178A6DE6
MGGCRDRLCFLGQEDDVEKYLDIAGINDLVGLKTSSDDVEEWKMAPDIFEIGSTVAIGDKPYDAKAAGKVGIATIGVPLAGFLKARYDKPDAARFIPGQPAGEVDKTPDPTVAVSG